ncbi:MAG TPA: efflux transporter outer membrane subunit [Candidatus Tectomicrobia bacterium]|nr:efflux transporter outer membrane subunit [Candidatus Tectomicrobia bacterium]
MSRPRLGVGVLLLVGVVGCSVGPNYRVPDMRVPATWGEASQPGVTAQPLQVTQWWRAFNDPVLDALVERAVGANIDLRQARARVREARALRGVAGADLWPTVGASGAYTRSRRSENLPAAQTGMADGTSAPGGVPSTPLEGDLFQVGFDTSWEIDLFGGVRRSIEAAGADLDASVEDLRDVLVTLLAEVTRNYVEVRGFQRRIAIARHNIRAQQETLELTQARFEAGLTSQLDVVQAASQLATTQAQVPALEVPLKQGIHRLGVLLGLAPGALWPELSREAPIPPVPPEVPVGLPSDLLRRRPDVRRAERQVAAATARIGVAVADLFPKLSLTGSLGLQSDLLADLPLGSSRFWSIGPTLSWPIFDAGRIRANIAVQDAREEQRLAQYAQTVLALLEEVENALVAYSREQVRRDKLAEAVEANRQAVALANELYTRGLGDFLNVLESQRSLFASQSDLVQSEATVSANAVALYKALGGGWEAEVRPP